MTRPLMFALVSVIATLIACGSASAPGNLSGANTGADTASGSASTVSATASCGNGVFDGEICSEDGAACTGTGKWSSWQCACTANVWSCADTGAGGGANAAVADAVPTGNGFASPAVPTAVTGGVGTPASAGGNDSGSASAALSACGRGVLNGATCTAGAADCSGSGVWAGWSCSCKSSGESAHWACSN